MFDNVDNDKLFKLSENLFLKYAGNNEEKRKEIIKIERILKNVNHIIYKN